MSGVYDRPHEVDAEPVSSVSIHLGAMLSARSTEQLWDAAEELDRFLAADTPLTVAELTQVLTAIPTNEAGQAEFRGLTDDEYGPAADIAIEFWLDALLGRLARSVDTAREFVTMLDPILDSDSPSWVQDKAGLFAKILYGYEPELPTESVQLITARLFKNADKSSTADSTSLSLKDIEARTDLEQHEPFLRQLGFVALSDAIATLVPRAGAAAGTWSSGRSSELFTPAIETLIASKGIFEGLTDWKMIKETVIPTYTMPFREPNLFILGEQVAPILAAEQPGPLRIAEVGCSNGSETWSLAAILTEQGIDHVIQAFDINPGVLYLAEHHQIPFNAEAREKLRAAGRGAYLSHFVGDGKYFASATDALRQGVTFAQHDIADQALRSDSVDVVIANNLFPYFTRKARNQIVSNMLAGLRPGGVFIFEGITDTFKGHTDYPEWARGLSRFGLRPFSDDPCMTETGVPNILRYHR